MKQYLTVGPLVVLALTALPVQLDAGAHAAAGGIEHRAGTWEDDCNLSKRNALSFAPLPGSPKSASWTRATIGYHVRGCRQVAAVDGSERVAALAV